MIRSLPSSQNFILKVIKSGETRQWGRSMKQIQKPECFSCSTENNLVFCGGKKSSEKQSPEGEDLIYISLLGLRYVSKRGKDTSGKNCWDRAWQLKLFPVIFISWFTYSRSVFTATAPPCMLRFGKHLSVLSYCRKWL